MADLSPQNAALARRELSDLERQAITGELLPEIEAQATIKGESRFPALDFGSALLTDTRALVSGSLGVLLAFLAAYFAFIAQHNIAVLWLLAFLSIAFASYRVWLKERHNLLAERAKLLAEQAKNAKPKIEAQILEVYESLAFSLGRFTADGLPSGQRPEGEAEAKTDSADKTPHDCFFTIRASVCNVHPVPTSLTFELWVQSPHANCKTLKSSVSDLLFKYDMHTTGAQGVGVSKIESRTEEMPDLEKACETPPATGHAQPGWLRFVLKKADNPIRRDIQAVTLVIKDVYGGTKLITSQRSEWRQSGEFVSKSAEKIKSKRYTDRAYGG